MSDVESSAPRDLAAAYTLGALDAAETSAFEAVLATSEELRREVAEYREVNALLALGAMADPPPADLRRRILERIGGQKVMPLAAARSPRAPWPAWVALAASLVVAVGLGIRVRDLSRRLAERNAAIDSVRQTLAAKETKLEEREKTLNSILDPAVQLHLLKSTGAPEPVIQLFLNPITKRAIVHAFHLQPTASGRAYQLWFIPKGGKPIPSVIFNSEPSGHAMVQQIEVPPGLDLTAAAVTDEPAGGSPQPTTPILLVGTLGA